MFAFVKQVFSSVQMNLTRLCVFAARIGLMLYWFVTDFIYGFITLNEIRTQTS